LKKKVLARNGTIVPLSAPTQGPLSLDAAALFMQGYHIHSNLVLSRGKHHDMLRFAVQHRIKPVVERYENEGERSFEKIFEKLGGRGVRYRAVLVAKDRSTENLDFAWTGSFP
jgi:D-arabinose 1-dehydrogenase-like Zn-dependent alcohol dehydrogenase